METCDTNVNNNWAIKSTRENISTAAAENLYNERIKAWFHDRFSKLSCQRPRELFKKFNCKRMPIFIIVFHYIQHRKKFKFGSTQHKYET